MAESKCPRCGLPRLPGCDGNGSVPVDEFTDRPCRNMLSILLREKLGPEISSSTHVTSSPLFQMTKGEPPSVDRTGDNLFLDCPWPNLLPHLKWVLGCKGLKFNFKIITDQQIKNVYVGNEQYRNQPLASREVREVFNSLSDFVEDYDLIILRLGFIGYPNRAAAGALLETLMIREAMQAAVWVIHEEDRPWLHSRSEEVEEYLRTHFESVDVEPVDPGRRYVGERSDDDLGLSVTDVEPEEEFSQEEPDPYEPEPDESDDAGDEVELLSRPKAQPKSKFKKGKGGRW